MTSKFLDLELAYKRWLGTPSHVIPFSHPDETEQIPTSLEVLIFQSGLTVSETQAMSYFVTAGLSFYPMVQTQELVELVMVVNGRYPLPELEKFAKSLAEIAVLPFRFQIPFAPNQVVCDLPTPLFEGMGCVLITDYFVRAPNWLYELKPPVRLLMLYPIFKNEAEIIQQIGDIEAYARFTQEKINLLWPKRREAALNPLTAVSQSHSTGKIKSMDTSTTTSNIHTLWQEIQAWCEKNAPPILETLQAGATEQQLTDFEKKLGITLPEAYKASLRIHNGYLPFSGYRYLDIASSLSTWEMMNLVNDRGDFANHEVVDNGSDIIQNRWWHKGLIPFAEDSGGNLICIDMAPASKGVVGQIMKLEVEESPYPTEFNSFAAWLKDFRDKLYRGHYMVSAEGFLV